MFKAITSITLMWIFLIPAGYGEGLSLVRNPKEWSVLVFMAADNNLSSYAREDIKEMESSIIGQENLGASTDKVDVLVEVDFAENSGSFRYHIEQFKESTKSIQSPIVAQFPEDYLDTKNRFSSFIKWGMENYPAQHYLVVIWGHGQGYRGVAFDDSDQSSLSPSDISDVMEQKVDILAFDACLMQSLEVISELSNTSQYILGSNQIQNYLGLPYRTILDKLQKSPSAYEVASQLPLWTEQSWQSNGYQGQKDPQAFESFTMSGIINAQLEYGIYPQLEKVSQLLLAYFEERENRIFDLQNRLQRAPHFQGGAIDIGLLLGLIEELLYDERSYGEDTKLSSQLLLRLRAAQASLSSGLIEHRFGPLYYTGITPDDYIMGYFVGVSIWLPQTSQEFQALKELYQKNALYRKVKSWPLVLDKLFTSNQVDLFNLD